MSAADTKSANICTTASATPSPSGSAPNSPTSPSTVPSIYLSGLSVCGLSNAITNGPMPDHTRLQMFQKEGAEWYGFADRSVFPGYKPGESRPAYCMNEGEDVVPIPLGVVVAIVSNRAKIKIDNAQLIQRLQSEVHKYKKFTDLLADSVKQSENDNKNGTPLQYNLSST